MRLPERRHARSVELQVEWEALAIEVQADFVLLGRADIVGVLFAFLYTRLLLTACLSF